MWRKIWTVKGLINKMNFEVKFNKKASSKNLKEEHDSQKIKTQKHTVKREWIQ